MRKGAGCSLVTHSLPHVTHHFLGKIFPVEDEFVEVGRIGVLVGNFTPRRSSSLTASPTHDAMTPPGRIPPELQLPGEWEYTPLISMSSLIRGSTSSTLGPPLVHIPDRGAHTHGSCVLPLEQSRRAAYLNASSFTHAA